MDPQNPSITTTTHDLTARADQNNIGSALDTSPRHPVNNRGSSMPRFRTAAHVSAAW